MLSDAQVSRAVGAAVTMTLQFEILFSHGTSSVCLLGLRFLSVEADDVRMLHQLHHGHSCAPGTNVKMGESVSTLPPSLPKPPPHIKVPVPLSRVCLRTRRCGRHS